jgi:hypothetical protein
MESTKNYHSASEFPIFDRTQSFIIMSTRAFQIRKTRTSLLYIHTHSTQERERERERESQQKNFQFFTQAVNETSQFTLKCNTTTVITMKHAKTLFYELEEATGSQT